MGADPGTSPVRALGDGLQCVDLARLVRLEKARALRLAARVQGGICLGNFPGEDEREDLESWREAGLSCVTRAMPAPGPGVTP